MQQYNKRPLQRLHEIGMVSPNLIAIHMTQINDDDLRYCNKLNPILFTALNPT